MLEHVGPLRVRRLRMPGPAAAGDDPIRLVFLHGFGAPGDDLVGLAPAIAAAPGTELIFPEAPLLLGQVMGQESRAWWPIDFERRELAVVTGRLGDLLREEPLGLVEARDALSATIDQLQRDEPRRLVLGGFSQGAMLALDLAFRTATPLEGLVVLSGTVIAEEAWLAGMPSRRGLRVFQSHGTRDPLLPFAFAERLRDALVREGLLVTFEAFASGHTIPPSVMAAFDRWLAGAP